jgi:hypothetical protein
MELDTEPDMTPEQQRMFMAYQQWMMQGSSPINGQLGMSLMPQLEKKVGDTNYQQDRMQMLGDPFSGFMAGMGAADYRTLQPTIEREIVEAPGLMKFQSWLGAGQDTAYQILADAMQGGADINSAFQIVKKNVEEFPDGVAAMSLPPGEDLSAQLSTLYGQVEDLDHQVNVDKAAGGSLDRFDPTTGAFFNETETPSKMKQMFTDMGLPSPDERYEVDPYAEQMGLAMEGQGYAGPMEMQSPYGRTTNSAGVTTERPDLGSVGLAEHSAILNSRLTGNDTAQRAIEDELAALALSSPNGGRKGPTLSSEDQFLNDLVARMQARADAGYPGAPYPEPGQAPSPIPSQNMQVPFNPESHYATNPRYEFPVLGGTGGAAPTAPSTIPSQNMQAPSPIPSQNMQVPFNPESHYAPNSRYEFPALGGTADGLPEFNGPMGAMPRNPMDDAMGEFAGRGSEGSFPHVPDMDYYSAALTGEGDWPGPEKPRPLPKMHSNKPKPGILKRIGDQIQTGLVDAARGRPVGDILKPWWELTQDPPYEELNDSLAGDPIDDMLAHIEKTKSQWNMNDAPWKSALRQRSLATAGEARKGKKRQYQQDIFDGVRERNKIRKQADPGSRNAVAAAGMKGRNAKQGQSLTLSDSGMSFHSADAAVKGLRNYLDSRGGSDPFTDAMRERMLYSQLNGF